MKELLCRLIAVICASVNLFAQDRTPIHLEHANSLQSFEANGVRWQELKGDVQMLRDSLTVTCQNAIYYPDSGIVIFRDNVEFRDPHRMLLAEQVIYNDLTQEVDASRDVRIYQSDTLSATARRAKYRERFKQAYLYDDVKLREEKKRILLTGDAGFLDHERQFGWVVGNPVLVERDSASNVLTEIHGDSIEYSDAEKLARVTGDVTVERDSLLAFGRLLIYSTAERTATLIGDPRAERGLDEMKGDTIRLFFEEEKLKRVDVTGNAITTSPADSGFSQPRNQMTGKQMTLWVTEGILDSALVDGNAIATYFVRDNKTPRGLNVTSGDKLHIYFEDRKISHIRARGGTLGDYTPQRLLSSTALQP